MEKMIRLSLFYLATAVAQIEDAPSLEIEAFLHSSTHGGLQVTKHPTVPSAQYHAFLLMEKYAQDLHYLHEFGITRVKIGRSGAIMSVKPLVLVAQKVVNALKVAMDHHHLSFDAKAMLRKVRSDPLKQVALRKVDQMAFLLQRFNEIKMRFAGPHDIDVGDAEGRKVYANNVRTRCEEMDVVYETLRGRARGFTDVIDHIRLADVRDYIASNDFFAYLRPAPVPYELTVGSDTSATVLDSFCALLTKDTAHKMFPAQLKTTFRQRLTTLTSKFRQMKLRYGNYNRHFRSRVAGLLPSQLPSQLDFLPQIRLAQRYRREALTQYQYFRIPFLSADGKRLLFNLYIADPEERGFRTAGASHGAAYSFDASGKVAATQFIDNWLLPIFAEVPPALFSGRLNDVIVLEYCAGCTTLGITSNDGRAIAIVDQGRSYWSTQRTVRHECGHVYSNKLFNVLEDTLTAICVSHSCLPSGVLPVLESASRLLDNVEFKTFGYGNNDRDRGRVSRLIDIIEIIWTGKQNQLMGHINMVTITRLQQEVSTLLPADYRRLKNMRTLYKNEETDRKSRSNHQFSLSIGDQGELPEFISYYASDSRQEEVAELAQHFAKDALRAGLYDASLYDPVLFEKVERFLDTSGAKKLEGESQVDFDARRALVQKWSHELYTFRANSRSSQRPLTVLILSEKGPRVYNKYIKDAVKKGEKLVYESIVRDGRSVSFMHLELAPGVDPTLSIKLNHGNHLTPDITYFGNDNNGGIFNQRDIEQAFQDALTDTERNFNGQHDPHATLDFAGVTIGPGCCRPVPLSQLAR